MYRLTLTQSEREAMDFVGGRYWNGHDLYTLLWSDSGQEPGDVDWDSPDDITFVIPEHVAWQIADNMEEEGLPLFSDELVQKFWDLRMVIV